MIKIFAKKLDYSLAILSEHIGNYHRITGNLERSLFFFDHSTLISKTLFEGAFDNPEFKNNLAISCQYLGNTHSVLGNLELALTFFIQYHQLTKELVDASPQNVEFINGLALSYQWLGKFYEDKLEDLNQAQAYYRQSNNLLLELVSRFPGYVQFKQNLDWVTSKLPDEADE